MNDTTKSILDGYGHDEEVMGRDSDPDLWPVNPVRARNRSLPSETFELVSASLISDFLMPLNEALTERRSTKADSKHTDEEKRRCLNLLFFYYDQDRDLTRRVFIDDVGDIFFRTLFFAGGSEVMHLLYHRIETEWQELNNKEKADGSGT